MNIAYFIQAPLYTFLRSMWKIVSRLPSSRAKKFWCTLMHVPYITINPNLPAGARDRFKSVEASGIEGYSIFY
ncbi:hypothetical protein PRUPE_5G046600 [Prunus persica]|uniref:Uncharacterized protein n=1 Tax=Prunus persica TaxID=3760 RepID=A0A251P3R9_PRUPE|nr:hypothetical protein PRUPE_5G046600 [Prunus persica]